MVEEKTNWDLIEKIDWKQVEDDMLNYVDDFRFSNKKTNKEILLYEICKLTGIQFTDISISSEKISDNNRTGYKMTLGTDSIRPELGICGRYIESFSFGLFHRTPTTLDNGDVILSFCPSLGYRLFSNGSNGFEVKGWVYYNITRKEWSFN